MTLMSMSILLVFVRLVVVALVGSTFYCTNDNNCNDSCSSFGVRVVTGFSFQQSQRVFVSTPAPKRLPKRIVSDYMDPLIHTLTPDMSIDETLKSFIQYGITAAPVVDSETNHKLVGIVSSYDFLQKEAFEGVLLPMGGEHCSQETVQQYVDVAKKVCGQKVEDVMSMNPFTVTTATPMKDAAAIMAQHHIQRLPVLHEENQQLVGMLTTVHIMQDLMHVMDQLPPASTSASSKTMQDS